MGNYTHLSMHERTLINTFLINKLPKSDIAKRLGRHRSAIYRELGRNVMDGVYMPSIAHQQAKDRRSNQLNKIDTHNELNKFVIKGLHKGWSPEQISGRMKQKNKAFYTCPESIYRYIYRHKSLGLYKLLPTKKSKRRARNARKTASNRLQIDLRNIRHRPGEINKRHEIGHWEGDTIRFPRDQNGCVTTLVERKSRLVCLRKNDDKKSQTVIDPICATIKTTSKKVWRTLTFDQGTEFMNFRKIERETKCKIYFCNPQSPWQRGSNENTNGRLRRYLPKKFEIDKVNQSYLDAIAKLLNNTPRKCLGYQTPNEVFKQHWKRFCRTSL